MNTSVGIAINQLEAQLSKKKNGGRADTYVYFGCIKDDVVYIGITKNLLRRAVEHQITGKCAYIIPINIVPLLRICARGVEQVLIERNRGTFKNKINSISVFNPWYASATAFGKAYLSVNAVYQTLKCQGKVK